MENQLQILHLFFREDRYKSLMIQLEEQGIKEGEYKIWEGEVHRHRRKQGICRSHKKIVQWAKDNGLKKVIIAEDDIHFSNPNSFKYYLEQTPKDFDLYLSMYYVGSHDENNRLTSICSGFTLYTVYESFYDTFLSIPDDSHVDREITKKHQDYKMYVIDKFVCWQDNGFSDNTLKKCDFTPYLENMNLYKGE